MLELSKILADFTPGAYGIWTGVLLFMAHMIREWRETRKLSAEDRLARREGYAKQVASLMAENRSLREDLARMEAEHNAHRRSYHEETDALRKKVRVLEDEISEIMRSQTTDQNAIAGLIRSKSQRIRRGVSKGETN